MKTDVAAGIEELQRQFPDAEIIVIDDDQGGARVILEPVDLGPKYCPRLTWVGFQIPAQYPYADIYPVFIGAEVRRSDGVSFQPPITLGHIFADRPAIQVSRRNSAAQLVSQRAPSKILKILAYLEKVAS